MSNATEDDNDGQSNAGETTDLNPDIPGGEQKQLPSEPQAPDALPVPEMGCGACSQVETVSSDATKKSNFENGQQAPDANRQSSKNGSDGSESMNDRSPKRPSNDDDQENSKRAKAKPPLQGVHNNVNSNNHYTAHQTGPATRSSTFLPKLRVETFEDSDDDNNSSYSSWAKEDITAYRNNYPSVRSNQSMDDNLKFYTNKICSHPDGDFIDNIHKDWFGQYRKLEYHHGYIQWLFPLQERGLNWSAQPLQKHEIESIKKNSKALKRVLESYKLMLDFYGFQLMNEKTGEIGRLTDKAYIDRFDNLNKSSHNYLRITRILKCLGELGYEHLKFRFLEAILRECIIENTLANCLQSCKDYWIETLRSQDERHAIRRYARELINYRNEGTRPPIEHSADRPVVSPSTPTTEKVESMSISDKDDCNPNP